MIFDTGKNLEITTVPSPTEIDRRLKYDSTFWCLRSFGYLFATDPNDWSIDPRRTPSVSLAGAGNDPLVLARLSGEWLKLVESGASPLVAGLAATRVAVQFAQAEAIDLTDNLAWMAVLQADRPPTVHQLVQVGSILAGIWQPRLDDLTIAEAQNIVSLWTLLGPAEIIMETGGDIRLLRDPQTNLNGYGCSHLPRPWAVTFASSTASSISERGYEAADRVRLAATAEMLMTCSRAPLSSHADETRRAIARILKLPEGTSVILAASGTDSELLALALGQAASGNRPITTILLAPEETGSGVPMAAIGRHFAIDTANGHDVTKASPIYGFREDTKLVAIPLRDSFGDVRPSADVESDIRAAVDLAIVEDRQILLHALDLSKTGLLAPSLSFLRGLRTLHEGRVEIVVDACQMRVQPDALHDYLAIGAIVQITGSKFLTGPPFAGAVLIPRHMATILNSGTLPEGLEAYFSTGDFPRTAPIARNLPSGANFGLILRWRAALAELKAFLEVPDERKTEVLLRFQDTVVQAIGQGGTFILQPAPPLHRERPGWDSERTIFAFAVRSKDGAREYLDPDDMRKLYRWLNADCSGCFDLDHQRVVASRICHIGQPVALPNRRGGQTGWLRVSAGARLLSGEPAHQDLTFEHRLDREMQDLRLVFEKISLLVQHWDRLISRDPTPRYR